MVAPVALNFGRDAHSYNAYAPVPSNNRFTATLVAATPTSCTVPLTATLWAVSFRYYPSGTSVFVDVSGAVAALPAGASLTASTSEGNPASYTLPGGANISVITSAATADVSVVMWPIGQS